MSTQLPLFPLNTVVFPQMAVPLHVFEDRYRAMILHLEETADDGERLFGTVSIREGYEVGEHGGQSLHRVGTILEIAEIEHRGDGSLDVLALGHERFRLDTVSREQEWPTGGVEVIPLPAGETDEQTTERTLRTFEEYSALLTDEAGIVLEHDHLPTEPMALGWALASTCLLTQHQRQELLESEDTADCLNLLTYLLRQEIAAIRALPSLPALDVARTGWSPN